jgi:hypothetical protein
MWLKWLLLSYRSVFLIHYTSTILLTTVLIIINIIIIFFIITQLSNVSIAIIAPYLEVMFTTSLAKFMQTCMSIMYMFRRIWTYMYLQFSLLLSPIIQMYCIHIYVKLREILSPWGPANDIRDDIWPLFPKRAWDLDMILKSGWSNQDCYDSYLIYICLINYSSFDFVFIDRCRDRDID